MHSLPWGKLKMEDTSVISNLSKPSSVLTFVNHDYKIDETCHEKKPDGLRVNARQGLFNVRAFFFLILWYFFSGCTLFLNKYILSFMNGDPTVLGEVSSHLYFLPLFIIL